jgi:hypothetical protein
LIEESLLSPFEKRWLSEYHTAILEKVSPRLIEKDELALAWLHHACR